MEDREDLIFDDLYNDFSKLVFHIAYQRVKDAYLAEDITQEVFLRMDANMDKFQSKMHVKAWLVRVTSNLCYDYLRKMTSEKKLLMKEQITTDFKYDFSDLSVEFWDSQKRVEQLMEKLYKKNKRWYIVTIKSYIEKVSNEELAKLFHVEVNAITSLQYRVRCWIGKELLKQNKDLKYIFDKMKKK